MVRGTSVGYDADNQVTGSGYAYNANGNPGTYQGSSFGYDGEDRVTSIGGMLTAGYKGNGQRAWKQTVSGSRTYYLYDGDNVVCEIGSSGPNAGQPIQAYGYGPFGLVQRYFTNFSTVPDNYYTYSFDPLGNLAGRHRKTLVAGESSVYAASLSAYDALGHLILDANANASGSFPPVDPIGALGQQGAYTDQETRPSGSATGLALLGAQSYYDASLGRMLNRSGGGLNEYEAETLPYRVLSNIGKGIINTVWSGWVGTLPEDLLRQRGIDPNSQAAQSVLYRFRHPFQVGSRPEERAAGLAGEGSAPALGALFAFGPRGEAEQGSLFEESELGPAVEKSVPNPGGSLGKPVTRTQIEELAEELKNAGYEITGGGGRYSEEFIPGPGPNKRLGSSRPDITAVRNGRILRINTADVGKRGGFTRRELRNAARIRAQKPNDLLILVPKRK